MFKTLVHIVLPLVLVALLFVGGWFWLERYTRHDVSRRVPELKGLGLEEARELLAKRDLEALVIDSIHNQDLPRGTVVDHDPPAGREVKPERKVYLILNAQQPKMIDMPRLIDMSKRQAISVLEIIGLRVQELQYRPDPCTDCVLDQLYKGDHIAPDSRIRRGEAVTLILGSGEKGTRVPVPDLRGLQFAEVRSVLNMASLNLGAMYCEGCNTKEDSAFARVRRQSPVPGQHNRIAPGGLIDVWLTSDTAGLRPVLDPGDPSLFMQDANDDSDVP